MYRVFTKLSRTTDVTITRKCRQIFGFELLSVFICKNNELLENVMLLTNIFAKRSKFVSTMGGGLTVKSIS